MEGERGPTQTAALLYNSKAATSSPDFYLINNLTVYFSIHQQCCSLRRNRVVFQWKWKRLNCDLPVIKLFLPLKYLGSGINENEETSWKINAKAQWSKNGITKMEIPGSQATYFPSSDFHLYKYYNHKHSNHCTKLVLSTEYDCHGRKPISSEKKKKHNWFKEKLP